MFDEYIIADRIKQPSSILPINEHEEDEEIKSKKKKKKKKNNKNNTSSINQTGNANSNNRKASTESGKSKNTSAWSREARAWHEFIKKHRKDLRKAKPVVDDSPPKLNVATIYNYDVLRNVRQGLNKEYERNQEAVKTLHTVNVTGGKTNTLTFDYTKAYSSNYRVRREDAKAIEKQNKHISHLIKSVETKMKTRKEYAEEWKLFEMSVQDMSEFPLFWKVSKKGKDEETAVDAYPPAPHVHQLITEKSVKHADKRPRVFLEISIENVGVLGKMIVLLYSDYVPMTVKNFLAFCDPKAKLTYKGSRFYLIFQDFYCQTGDVTENQGYGGTSIYGPYFHNEDLTLKHRERGVLTMHNITPNRNQSQFLITFRKLQSLDGQNVAFGKVIKGFNVLDAIESVGSKITGLPKVKIYISDCDEI